MRYVCPVCGYVYDEDGQGKPWAELPSDWECPICGAPKAVFAAEGAPQESGGATEVAAAGAGHADIPLTAAELSAICSNLARGCEKQYMDEERELFAQLAGHYSALVPPAEGDFSALAAAVKRCADGEFAAAKRAAESAADRGAMRAVNWGERVNFILSALLEKYGRDGIDAPDGAHVWVCSICGFIYIGRTPPDVCPVCRVPAFRFEDGGELT